MHVKVLGFLVSVLYHQRSMLFVFDLKRRHWLVLANLRCTYLEYTMTNLDTLAGESKPWSQLNHLPGFQE